MNTILSETIISIYRIQYIIENETPDTRYLIIHWEAKYNSIKELNFIEDLLTGSQNRSMVQSSKKSILNFIVDQLACLFFKAFDPE